MVRYASGKRGGSCRCNGKHYLRISQTFAARFMSKSLVIRNIRRTFATTITKEIDMEAEYKKAKSMKLSDFYGALKDADFPSASEIREVMQDEDKEITII